MPLSRGPPAWTSPRECTCANQITLLLRYVCAIFVSGSHLLLSQVRFVIFSCAQRAGRVAGSRISSESGPTIRRRAGDISLCVSPARRRFPVSETGLHHRPGNPISKHRLSHDNTRGASRHGAVWFLDYTDGGRGSRPRRGAKHLACYHVRGCDLTSLDVRCNSFSM